jgi:protein involved in polysaccharide export with SLBB domain
VRKLRTSALLALIAASLAACNTIRVRPGKTEIAAFKIEPGPAEYRLKPGDRLAFMFLVNLARDVEQEYRLEIGDEIKLTVQDREDLTGQYFVVPDGWLHLPLLRPIRVRGLSLGAAKKAIVDAYEPVVPNAEVTVSLTRFNSRANAFVASLTQGGIQGPVFETTLELDGTAILPHVGQLELAGLTLAEANAEVDRLYGDMVPGIDVTTRLSSSRGHVVTVLGEVKRPGAFEVAGLVTLTEALGMAEGWLPSGHLASVVVVQPRKELIHVTQYDLANQILVATQVQLAPGDFVWVPRNGISNLNAWVDQFIRRNIPINIGVGIPIPVN